jgi:hypothetical protein
VTVLKIKTMKKILLSVLAFVACNGAFSKSADMNLENNLPASVSGTITGHFKVGVKTGPGTSDYDCSARGEACDITIVVVTKFIVPGPEPHFNPPAGSSVAKWSTKDFGPVNPNTAWMPASKFTITNSDGTGEIVEAPEQTCPYSTINQGYLFHCTITRF